MNKLESAAKQFNIKEIAIAGGVSANSELRREFLLRGKRNNWNCYVPDFGYCTDNAAMIAITGFYKYLAGDFVNQDAAPSAHMTWT